MSAINRGVAIVHYNRSKNLEQIIPAIKKTVPKDTKIVLCDDGSFLSYIPPDIVKILGPNKGVAANKNRALFALQDCHFIAIIEDDLMPTEPGWFEIYEKACVLSEIHHFCRIQDKLIEETIPEFSEFMKQNDMTPIYTSSPRGDLTFITSQVIRSVGGLNSKFKGVGYAHGEWSERVYKSGLIPHPLKWVDIREARDKFVQIGDTEGGRWNDPKEDIKEQLKRNAQVLKELKKEDYIHHPLVLE